MISTRRAVVAISSAVLGPAGVVWLLAHGRLHAALPLTLVLIGYWLAELIAFEVRWRYDQQTRRMLQRINGKPLRSVTYSREAS